MDNQIWFNVHMNDLKKILADNLTRLMEKTPGLGTQDAVSKKAKRYSSTMSQSTIGRIQNADTNATLEKIDALARTFGVPPWELLKPEISKESENAHRFTPPLDQIAVSSNDEFRDEVLKRLDIGKQALIALEEYINGQGVSAASNSRRRKKE